MTTRKITLALPAAVRVAGYFDLRKSMKIRAIDAIAFVRIAERASVKYQAFYDPSTYFVDEIYNTLIRMAVGDAV